MSESSEGKNVAPPSGIEKKQDEANLEHLINRHPNILPEKIAEVYSAIKEEIIEKAAVRTYILPLAYRLTHERLTKIENPQEKPEK